MEVSDWVYLVGGWGRVGVSEVRCLDELSSDSVESLGEEPLGFRFIPALQQLIDELLRERIVEKGAGEEGVG